MKNYFLLELTSSLPNWRLSADFAQGGCSLVAMSSTLYLYHWLSGLHRQVWDQLYQLDFLLSPNKMENFWQQFFEHKNFDFWPHQKAEVLVVKCELFVVHVLVANHDPFFSTKKKNDLRLKNIFLWNNSERVFR